MATNEGTVDRGLRVLLGVDLILLGAWPVHPAPLGTLLVIVGLISLLTGALGWCPVYSLAHFNSFVTKR